MKTLSIFIASFVLMSSTSWNTNWEKAKELAAKNHQFILLSFSGSDWCGPCIRLHKEIFNSDVFSKYADSALVLVNADFPRQKKNQLSKDLQAQNDQLADKYNNKGAFPYTVLLDANGKVIKQWDGLPKETPEAFTNEVKSAVDAVR